LFTQNLTSLPSSTKHSKSPTRIQVFFIVVEEAVIIIAEEVETVENAEVVMVAVAFLVVTALTS